MISSELTDLGTIGALLARTVESGRLSPSYLFEGTDEETVREIATAFAIAVLAHGREGEDAARQQRRLRAGTHPDLYLCTKDKPTVISVDALSEVLAQAHRTPLEGAHQVFMIEPAEAMEPEGIARYLKTLEEPPEACVFLLLTSRPDRLPATVLSRVKRVRIPPLDPDTLARRLEAAEVDPAMARRVALYAGGSLARARRLADAETLALAGALARAGRAKEPEAARVVEGVLSQVDRTAADLAANDVKGADVKREYVRTLLADLVHVFGVEARDRAAERGTELLADVRPDAALDLLTRLGEVSAAIPANVTPAVLLFEVVRALGRSFRD